MALTLTTSLLLVKPILKGKMAALRQLKEIAKEVLTKKFSGDDKKMADEMGVERQFVRRVTGKAAHQGENQQKAFEFTVKILRLCEELEIPAQDLKQQAAEEDRHAMPIIKSMGSPDVPQDTTARPKNEIEKKSSKRLQTRRN